MTDKIDNDTSAISLLPGVNQTNPITNFFGATVDQLFRPGASEQISGYIGQVPSYDNPETDFYKQEPSTQRRDYQLEAGTVVRNTDTTINSTIGYDDLIYNLSANGAFIDNPNRLFADQYYAWAPPVDIDKLCNFHEYAWFGDDIGLIPTLVLTAPSETYTASGSRRTFAMPTVINGASPSDETPMLFVNGIDTPFTQSGNNLVTATYPSSGSTVVVYRYGDITKVLLGKTTFDIRAFGSESQGANVLVNDMRISISDGVNFKSGWDEVAFDTIPFDGSEATISTYIVDGVGKSIRLVPSIASTTIASKTPKYIVIARGSSDGNPWSQMNNWYHVRSFAWANKTFPTRRANRPILEFVQNIELFDYGFKRVSDVDGVVLAKPLFDPMAEGISAFKRDVSNLQAIDISEINGKPINSIFVSGHLVKNGDRILVVDQTNPDLAGRILTVTLKNNVLVIVAGDAPSKGDVVRVKHRGFIPYDTTANDTTAYDYDTNLVEYHFDGASWVETSAVDPTMTVPTFAVYDDSGKRLAKGNKIFGFTQGSGANDLVLGIPLSYDNQGQIVFENFLVTDSQTSGGYQFYHVSGDGLIADYYSNGWHLSDKLSNQTVLSESEDSGKVWSVPTNLSANPNNNEITRISRSQWMDHMISILENQTGFSGNSLADNNWQDTEKNIGLGTFIVQNRSPMLKTMYLIDSSETDFVQSCIYAEREYARYKNAFLQKIQSILRRGTLDVTDTPKAWCDELMAQMTIGKTSSSPFSANTVGNGQYYIPPTPSYLGLRPNRLPMIEPDSTYTPSIRVIVGHDCSRTPLMGDYRDAILLELETRIYNSIQESFRKDYVTPFDFNDFDSSKARPLTDRRYRVSEIDVLRNPNFTKWAQANGFNYRSNTSFSINDPFTFNYTGLVDAYGNTVKGSWRAIYLNYFDTDRPHSHPWEMLGFSEKPSWFDANYGIAPYTSGNTKLWNDIANGAIIDGFRKGTDARYARPYLLSHLPVDEGGNLLDPVSCGIVSSPSMDMAKADWVSGDIGPVENLWRCSSSYAFAMCRVSYLMRPVQFIEMGWDCGNLKLVNGQWTNIAVHRRPKCSDLTLHGETDANGNVVKIIGIQQWISDYICSKSLPLVSHTDFIRSLDTNLFHKMAGFTTSDIKLYTDNFGLIPQEDFSVVFHQSQPIGIPSYSGVIIELVDNGWRVVGYDPIREYFTILPVDPYSYKTTLSLGTSQASYDWRPNTYYAVKSQVQYAGKVYSANISHTSGPIFETSFWTQDSSTIAIAPSAVMYSGNLTVAETVPYSTVFITVQEVVDFLSGLAAHQASLGWKFDTVDDNGVVIDWYASIVDFMEWAQVRWQPGNFIALSPGASSLILDSGHGYTLSANDYSNGNYNLINRTGGPIKNDDLTVSRIGTATTFKIASEDLFFARATIVEVENVLVFNNLTIFKDIIFDPLFSLRQPRIRMIGKRTQDWNGRYEAPGFIILNGTVFSNFYQDAENIRLAFDVEQSQDKVLRDYARHDIGYEARPYLDNLLLSDTSQFEFYQGFIKTKGTVGAFDKIVRNKYAAQDSGMQFLEEWAFRVGTYGAVAKTNTYAFGLVRTNIVSNPQIVRFTDADLSTSSMFSVKKTDWVDNASDSNDIFPIVVHPDDSYDDGFTRSAQTIYGAKNLPTAGYVRFSEVTYCAMSTSKLNDLYAYVNTNGLTFDTNTVVWIYSDPTGNWDVWKLYPMGSTANPILFIEMNYEDSTLGNKTKLVFKNNHGLSNSDIGSTILIQGASNTTPNVEGFHRIVGVVEGSNIVYIPVTGQTGINYEENGGDTAPLIYILRSHRFNDIAAATSFSSAHAQTNGSFAYVDGTSWKVYTWNGSWTISREQPPMIDSSLVKDVLVYSSGTKVSSSASIMPEPLNLSSIAIYDPVKGFINSVAEAELTFKHEYDPARYNNNTDDCWGRSQIGSLWWDLSSIRYLETETDILTSGNATRTDDEMKYRAEWWGKAAPGSSFDVYEWTRSYETPNKYSGDGTVYNPTSGTHWVQVEEFDQTYNKIMTVYYYWVSGSKIIPVANDRKYSAYQVSYMFANPQDMIWCAPINTDTMLLNGVAPFLTDSDSILQFGILSNAKDGNVHTEWALVKANDDSSLPPTIYLDALRRSIVGYDDFARSVPDLTIPANRRIGTSVRPRQSLFAFDDSSDIATRKSLIDGRTIFLTIVNDVLSKIDLKGDRNGSLNLLDKNAPIFDLLFWSGNAPILYPPLGTYDFSSTSLDSRNAIFASAAYLSRVAKGENPRVLLTNFDAPTLSWGIWQIDPSKPSSLPLEQRLVLAKNYDCSVGNRVELQILVSSNVLTKYSRILITSDEDNGNVWSIVSNFGDTLSAIQTYKTSDFYTVSDYYADGYSPDRPPLVSYKTVAIRNRLETVPTNTFVKIVNGGEWTWTVYDETVRNWKVVARKGTTIQLSNRFLDANAPVFGIGTSFKQSDFAIRDGSIELGIIFDVLFNTILVPQEINTIWFALVKYLHSIQDQVNWAFKSSYMSIKGDESLTQTPILGYDNTPNIVSYVNETKPYRVKIRDFLKSYAIKDVANVSVTDFDRPPCDDGRILDNTNASDVAIMSATGSNWKHWYDNYTKTGNDPSDISTYNPVRKMDITIKFDRIDPGLVPFITPYGWDMSRWNAWPWDNVPPSDDPFSTALSRMIEYYTPTNRMIEKDASLLFGLGFKGLIVNGGSFTDFVVDDVPSNIDIIVDGADGQNIEVEYNSDANPRGLLDPHHDEWHPEEFVLTRIHDGLTILAESKWTSGAPNQSVSYVYASDYRASTVEVYYSEIAQKNEAIWVFRDGQHVDPSQYVVDHFLKKVNVNLLDHDFRLRELNENRLRDGSGRRLRERGNAEASNVTVHVFGLGGTTPILEQRFFDGNGSRTSFAMLTAPHFVEVIIDGKLVFVSTSGLRLLEDGGDYQLTEDDAFRELEGMPGEYSVSIDGNNVIVTPPPPLGSDVMIVSRDYNPSNHDLPTGVYTMSQALVGNALKTWPLSYPSTGIVPEHAATILENDQGYRLRPPSTVYATIGENTTTINVGNVSNSANIKVWINGALYNSAIPMAGNATDAQALNVDIVLVGTVLYVFNITLTGRFVVSVYERHDYVVANGLLTVVNPLLASSNNYVVHTFQNAVNMGIETWCFDGNANGTYVFDGSVKNIDYSLVTVDGAYLTGNVNYAFKTITEGGKTFTRVSIPPMQEPSQKVVLTLFKGYSALTPSVWFSSSKKFDMGDAMMMPYDGETPVFDTIVLPKYGTVKKYRMKDSFSIVKSSLGSVAYLTNDLSPDAVTVNLRLHPIEISNDFVPENPLPLPEGNVPGAIWIDGECIEYFGIVRNGNDFTLSQLRRGSKRTALGITHLSGTWAYPLYETIDSKRSPFIV